jgi:hypothetical protein
VSQTSTIGSLEKQTLMMVTPLSKETNSRLHLYELGICGVCSMHTSTITQEGKGQPHIKKNTNSIVVNKSTKALQIIKCLEGIFNGNQNISMGTIFCFTHFVNF